MLLADNKKWSFSERLQDSGLADLRRGSIDTLQVNVGKRCNQACLHCHVEAGPKRTEEMTRATAERIIVLLAASPGIRTLDITGGAPELNQNFRWMVEQARELGREVIDRCNLTIFFEEGMEDLPAFLAEHRVRVVASMPCYSLENVDAQRGKGAFDKSIRGLKILNSLGYGKPEGDLQLDLVYNPGGPYLPPAQKTLEASYRERLAENFEIEFNSLLTLTNLPVKRFADSLARSNKLDGYMDLLVENFNAETLPGLMCLSQLSISWDGRIFDCDFNQMLEIESILATDGVGMLPVLKGATIHDIRSVDDLRGSVVRTAPHCFGCTAGAGSSCGGAISS